jgi:hypothetical protein
MFPAWTVACSQTVRAAGMRLGQPCRASLGTNEINSGALVPNLGIVMRAQDSATTSAVSSRFSASPFASRVSGHGPRMMCAKCTTIGADKRQNLREQSTGLQTKAKGEDGMMLCHICHLPTKLNHMREHEQNDYDERYTQQP